jgi:hypothetical protein
MFIDLPGQSQSSTIMRLQIPSTPYEGIFDRKYIPQIPQHRKDLNEDIRDKNTPTRVQKGLADKNYRTPLNTDNEGGSPFDIMGNRNKLDDNNLHLGNEEILNHDERNLNFYELDDNYNTGGGFSSSEEYDLSVEETILK